MTLTTRLLLFFPATLAAILVAFSLTIYVLAQRYLSGQIQERLEAAADTLVASVDIEPDSVEWEPSDRDVKLLPGPLGGQMHWFILDPQGRQGWIAADYAAPI